MDKIRVVSAFSHDGYIVAVTAEGEVYRYGEEAMLWSQIGWSIGSDLAEVKEQEQPAQAEGARR